MDTWGEALLRDHGKNDDELEEFCKARARLARQYELQKIKRPRPSVIYSQGVMDALSEFRRNGKRPDDKTSGDGGERFRQFQRQRDLRSRRQQQRVMAVAGGTGNNDGVDQYRRAISHIGGGAVASGGGGGGARSSSKQWLSESTNQRRDGQCRVKNMPINKKSKISPGFVAFVIN